MKTIGIRKSGPEMFPADMNLDRHPNNDQEENGLDEIDTNSNRASQVLESESICYGTDDVIRGLLG